METSISVATGSSEEITGAAAAILSATEGGQGITGPTEPAHRLRERRRTRTKPTTGAGASVVMTRRMGPEAAAEADLGAGAGGRRGGKGRLDAADPVAGAGRGGRQPARP